MNVKHLQYSVLLILLAASVSAADRPESDARLERKWRRNCMRRTDRLNQAARAKSVN